MSILVEPITSKSSPCVIQSQCPLFGTQKSSQHAYSQYLHSLLFRPVNVCLPGQGIWYGPPEAPESQMAGTGLPQHLLAPSILYSKSYFNLSEDAFVYFCPQSVFKIHPLFDFVLRDILISNPMGHIVVTEGRRPSWTDAYAERLRRSLGDVLMHRLHLIERVSAEKFMSLLRIADVMLHPFPFDGSRTSADGFAAGIPVLTMPTGAVRFVHRGYSALPILASVTLCYIVLCYDLLFCIALCCIVLCYIMSCYVTLYKIIL